MFEERLYRRKTPGTLDQNNARFSAKNYQLHPTKGWRKISVRRTLIADITQRIKAGQHGLNGLIVKRILNREVFI